MRATHICQSQPGSQISDFSTFNIGKNFTVKLCTRLRQQVHRTISTSTLLTSGVIPALKPLMLAIAVSGFRSSNCGQIQQKEQPDNCGQYCLHSQGRSRQPGKVYDLLSQMFRNAYLYRLSVFSIDTEVLNLFVLTPYKQHIYSGILCMICLCMVNCYIIVLQGCITKNRHVKQTIARCILFITFLIVNTCLIANKS